MLGIQELGKSLNRGSCETGQGGNIYTVEIGKGCTPELNVFGSWFTSELQPSPYGHFSVFRPLFIINRSDTHNHKRAHSHPCSHIFLPAKPGKMKLLFAYYTGRLRLLREAK